MWQSSSVIKGIKVLEVGLSPLLSPFIHFFFPFVSFSLYLITLPRVKAAAALTWTSPSSSPSSSSSLSSPPSPHKNQPNHIKFSLNLQTENLSATCRWRIRKTPLYDFSRWGSNATWWSAKETSELPEPESSSSGELTQSNQNPYINKTLTCKLWFLTQILGNITTKKNNFI